MSGVLEFDASLFGPLWYGAGLAHQENQGVCKVDLRAAAGF
ncbi:hypothetical protein [Saccharopolyspora hattusasensis]